MPVVTTLGRLRWEDHLREDFKTSLGHIVRPVSENKTKHIQIWRDIFSPQQQVGHLPSYCLFQTADTPPFPLNGMRQTGNTHLLTPICAQPYGRSQRDIEADYQSRKKKRI
jgi:hypothetical protein